MEALREIARELITGTILGVSISLFVFVGTTSVLSQERSTKIVNRETYSRILDSVFMNDENGKQAVLSSLSVRFVPSFLPESQVTLIRTKDKAKIIYLRSDENIYGILLELAKKTEPISVEAVRKSAKIASFVYELRSDEGDKWLADFFLALPETLRQLEQERIAEQKNNSASVALDGGFYVISATHGLNKFSSEVYDENPQKTEVTGEYALTRLSNRLRIDVSNRLPRK